MKSYRKVHNFPFCPIKFVQFFIYHGMNNIVTRLKGNKRLFSDIQWYVESD